jgi:hypothetical protein
MTNPLEKLLRQLGVDPDSVEILGMDCSVEQNIARYKGLLTEIPGVEAPSKELVSFTLGNLRDAAKEMVKDGKRKELELEMRLLDKPDDVDLGSEEHKHTAMHIEEEQLAAEVAKRKGDALLRFCDLIEGLFPDEVG